MSSITCSLSDEEKQQKLRLVVDLLTGIHLCAAAEAISLAHHVGIPLPQLYELACDAAGGSAMFKSLGADMIAILRGEKKDSVAVLGGYAEKLAGALDEAQAGKSKDLASLLGYYSVE